MADSTLAKTYDPKTVETDVWRRWEDADAFHAEPDPSGKPYVVVIPPPNVTAALHLGHALNNTLQDVLVRWRRMCGDNAVWLPGTDHAGIATQTVVDKRLKAEGQPSLVDYKKLEAEGEGGREQFVEKVQAWKDEYEATITNQLKKMGCSCDWQRRAFTMDEPRAKAVREAFFQLFRDGLIYRGKRLVNWDPATQTALADDEVEMHEIDGHFWYLRYPVVDGENNPTGEYVTVATTRPETMLGDTAVAVNPGDAERARFIGQSVRLPIVNRIIPVVGDDYVVPPDPESDDPMKKYASGFLKVTPAHDPNDYEIGQRHNLPAINVMAPDGSISDQHGWPAEDFARGGEDLRNLLGLDRYEAREAIVDWFRANDLLADVRPYRHTVGHSYRSHVAVEPYLSDQWYVKATDPRLAGAALKAMAPDQRSSTSDASTSRDREPQTSRDREGADAGQCDTSQTSRDREGADAPLRGAPLAYFISFTGYGNWLHGDDRGSVDREHNLPGEPIMLGDEMREHRAFEQSDHPAVSLDKDRRRAVQDAIVEVCEHRGWALLALHVRPEHVHVVVAADATPERVMNDFKAYATRKLRARGCVENERRVWTRHGSTRYLNDEQALAQACEYVIEHQGAMLEPPPVDQRRSGMHAAEAGDARIRGTGHPLPHGRGSLGGDAEGALRFVPERYAKTFETWHENIRDWCISRQLWWGHRIPVWQAEAQRIKHFDYATHEDDWQVEVQRRLDAFATALNLDGDFAVTSHWAGSDFKVYLCASNDSAAAALEQLAKLRTRSAFITSDTHLECDPIRLEQGAWASAEKVAEMIVVRDQDPDVLDTWFSSALWPLSTLGWPDETAELSHWNPTSTLSTAREIITLWVSRMVMFNLYFRGCVPFFDVFIHAMIQDGEGRKMSKSLGNGVDPLDIIHSHGADAMRYTLASMTTHTQDVRMPVETDSETGRNTSPKFDQGRNFCNKLWNAGRFAMENLADAAKPTDGHPWALADRWVLSRLGQTLRDVNAALAGYQFAHYAQLLYDFFWRDLCDWYLEAIKPVVRGNDEAAAAAKATLAACLDAALRMLHPAVPFITETLWSELNRIAPERGDPAVPGLSLPPSDLCIHARWPETTDAILDADAERRFDLIREVVGELRNIRAQYNVPPRQAITARFGAAGDAADALKAGRSLIETLAGAEVNAIEAGLDVPEDAASSTLGELTIVVEGLIDPEAERERLSKRKAELEKSRNALSGRLSNPGYVDKAPAHLVEQTREQLAETERELEAVEASLSRL